MDKHYYIIYYEGDNPERTASVVASSAGDAFARFQSENPDAKIIKAYREGGALGGFGRTEYDPPSTAKPHSEIPEEKTEQLKLL